MAVKTDLAEVADKIETYRIDAAVSTLSPADMGGATGSVTFTTAPVANPFFLRNREFTITDTAMGSSYGRVSELEYDKEGITVTAETSLQKLTATTTFAPVTGTALSCMNQILAPAGFTCTGLDNSASTSFPGWTGSYLDYMKHYCTVFDVEYYVNAASPTVVVFRAIRTKTVNGTFSSLSYTINDQTLAKNIQLDWYLYSTSGLATLKEFTPAYAAQTPQILTVDPGATAEYDIQVNGWPTVLNQPTAVDYVGPAEGTVSQYCVAGNDGLPVTAAQWTAQGGSVVVSLSKDDPTIIHVKVTAPPAQSLPGTDGGDRYGPYSIAATAVDGNAFYNSLHIVGTGLRFYPVTTLFLTGAVSTTTIEDIGATISNPFVNSWAAAYKVGVKAAQVYSGPTHALGASFVPKTAVISDHVGARYTADNGNIFRIESVTADTDGISVSGSADTLLSESDTLWTGKTLGNYDTNWTGRTLNDQAAAPLWKAS